MEKIVNKLCRQSFPAPFPVVETEFPPHGVVKRGLKCYNDLTEPGERAPRKVIENGGQAPAAREKEARTMEHTFGERLKKYRQEKRLTQQELADLLGVSNKTISRWESDGGFPDVPVLVPLARALGVTVDDLLDGERPIRAMSRGDWQSLLSFAFALGGGVLFFLLDLFMPAALCWLAYLVCMAYGVYLQKYYAYQSRWFFPANVIVNLSVNFSIAGKVIPAVIALRATLTPAITQVNIDEFYARLLWWLAQNQLLVPLMAFALAIVMTVVTQRIVLRWSKGSLYRKIGIGYRLRLGLCRPTARKLLPLLIPVTVTLFWYITGREGRTPSAYMAQMGQFKWVIALCTLFCLVLFWKKGCRGMLLPAWGLTALCARYRLLAPVTQKVVANWNRRIFDYEAGMNPDVYTRFTQWGKELVILAVLAALAYLVFCVIHIDTRPEPKEE